MLDTLDAAAVRRWCGGGLAALRAHQHEIDELNVYPVPDGDTGTNLVLTLSSALQALTHDPDRGAESTDPGAPPAAAPEPTEPHPTEPGSADPGSADPDPAGFDSAGSDSADPASTRLGSTEPGSMGPAPGGPASGGPASGGPASGGPASGGPASGGPASGGSGVADPESIGRIVRAGTEAEAAAGGGVADTGIPSRTAADERPGADGRQTPLGRALRLMARGALLGARGNSGVIVSQILRGMADSLAAVTVVRGRALAAALRSATDTAYAAVAKPVEGTVLSVLAAAAEAAARIKSDDIVVVARAAARAATEALARTPLQLPELARAGVVDAGGRGLCLLLDALVEALSGTAPSAAPPSAADSSGTDSSGTAPSATPADITPADTMVATITPAGTTARSATGTAAMAAAEMPAPGIVAPDGAAQHHGGPAENAAGEPTSGPPATPALSTRRESGSAEFAYEVQYLLDAQPAAVEVLKPALAALGDSLVVVGTGDGTPPTWNVHVHVNDVGAAIEAGIEAGRPYRIAVTRFADQAGGDRATDRLAASRPAHDHPVVHPAMDRPAMDPQARAAVVVAAGDGLTALFEAEGATVVGRNPSTAEVLDAIRSTGVARVVLLPNDANTHAVATSAAREAAIAGIRVSVVPTRSPVQALAALAVRDPGRAFSEDVIAMAEAAGACRYGEVCTASRDALTVAGRCHPGDLLGLVDGEVHVIGTDLAEVCRRLIDRMLGGGGELVTLVLGVDAPPELEEVLREHAGRTWPFIDLQCYAGGQPRYHLLVGVE